VHRSGRTARAGRVGHSIVILGRREVKLLNNIELMLEIKIEELNWNKKQTQEIANAMHAFNTANSKAIVYIAESNFDD